MSHQTGQRTLPRRPAKSNRIKGQPSKQKWWLPGAGEGLFLLSEPFCFCDGCLEPCVDLGVLKKQGVGAVTGGQ